MAMIIQGDIEQVMTNNLSFTGKLVKPSTFSDFWEIQAVHKTTKSLSKCNFKKGPTIPLN